MPNAMPDFGAGIRIVHMAESEVHWDDFGRALHNVPRGTFRRYVPRGT
jgi:hypothetical protein